MLGQTFDLIDIPRLLALSLLEIVLSADNAIVLGVLSNALPPFLRRRALYIGALSAFISRAAAIFFVSLILHSLWIELLGAAYLIYLSIHHFFKKKEPLNISPSSFWKTVLLIELFDFAFAIDSIIAGVAFIATPSGLTSKLWIVYAGGMIGLLFIRYAADLFSRLIDHLPRLETSAYLLVGLIGLKLALTSIVSGLEYFFWAAFLIILGFGFKRPKAIK